MRVFLCSFNNFSIAIPINFVSSIMLFNTNPVKTIAYNKNDRNVYVSLPLLLKYPAEKIKHGIILKNKEDDDIRNINEIGKTSEGRIILLTTEIERETEIQDDKIFSIQKIFNGMKFFFFFSGIFFNSLYNSSGNSILILNPDFFIKKLKRYRRHDKNINC
jgi:hypothetical protein